MFRTKKKGGGGRKFESLWTNGRNVRRQLMVWYVGGAKDKDTKEKNSSPEGLPTNSRLKSYEV